MLDRTTSRATPNAISSQGSGDGRPLYDSRIGPIIEKYGLEAVLANLSPSQAAKVGLLTHATSGPFFDTSSRSAALQSSLESRLRALLNGSDLCEVTWKKWDAPWGQCLSKPRARVRTTFGTDTGSWPTPTTRDHKDGGYCPNVPVNGLLGRMVLADVFRRAIFTRAWKSTGRRLGNSRPGWWSSPRLAIGNATMATPRASEAEGRLCQQNLVATEYR